MIVDNLVHSKFLMDNSGSKFEPPALLVGKVVDFLIEAIVEGRLTPGEQLTELSLYKEFGISRSPIREAFRILEERGFIINVPRKGCYIRMVTKKDIEEIFPIRSILEGFAARCAVPKMTEEHFGRLDSSLTQMIRAAEGNDFKSFLHHHYEFHRIYINVSQNELLKKIMEPLLNQALWYRNAFLYFHESFEYSIEKHSEILETFRNRRPREAEKLVRNHIMVAMQSILNHISKREEAP